MRDIMERMNMNEIDLYNFKRARLTSAIEEVVMKKKLTQRERILRHLEDFGSITSLQAFTDYSITRLSAIIFDLKHKYDIPIDSSERITKKNRYGEKVSFTNYKLIGDSNGR